MTGADHVGVLSGAHGHGVGYARIPRPGEIAELHGVDAQRRALCGAQLLLTWPPEESQATTIDCPACLAIVEQQNGSTA